MERWMFSTTKRKQKSIQPHESGEHFAVTWNVPTFGMDFWSTFFLLCTPFKLPRRWYSPWVCLCLCVHVWEVEWWCGAYVSFFSLSLRGNPKSYWHKFGISFKRFTSADPQIGEGMLGVWFLDVFFEAVKLFFISFSYAPIWEAHCSHRLFELIFDWHLQYRPTR